MAAGFFFTKSAICASGNISCKVDPKQMVAAHQLLLLWLAVMDVAFQISKLINLFGTLTDSSRGLSRKIREKFAKYLRNICEIFAKYLQKNRKKIAKN